MPKIAYENCVFDVLDVIFMSFACPFQIIGCNLANMPGDISSENLLENFVFVNIQTTHYALLMF